MSAPNAPVGTSPMARRRRALGSHVPYTAGSHKGDASLGSGKGMFSATGAHFATTEFPTPDLTHSTYRPRPQPESEHAGSEGFSDLGASGDDRRAIIRHNACFLHPHGLDDGTGFQPIRPFLHGIRYDLMVKETIAMKGSQDFQRVQKHAELSKRHEAQNKEWAESRFKRVRDAAAMQDEMRPTYDAILGRTSREVPDDDPRNEVVNQFYATAPEFRSSASASREPSERVPPSAQGGRIFKTAPIAPDLFRELEAKGLCTRPARTTSQPVLTKTRRGEGPQVRQTAGSRGHPKNFVPAIAMHTGLMMWQKDRSTSLKGLMEEVRAAEA